jgi:DNA-binding response OmpR family regulator
VAVMRILVVEDEPSVAQFLAEAIRAAGHEVLVALDGAEAFDVLEATPVAGVFLDLVMPGLSGIPLLGKIHTRHPELPVVILSAHADDEAAAARAMELGAVAVLEKPAALAQLDEILSRLQSAC